MHPYRFLDASLAGLSAIITSSPSLDANGTENDLLKLILAYPYEKGETTESLFEPLNLEEKFIFPP